MNAHDNTSLLQAIQSGDTTTLRNLAFDQQQKSNNSDLLHYTAGLRNPEIVEILLKNGWKDMVSVFDEVGFTPLHWSARGDTDLLWKHSYPRIQT